MTKNIDSNLDPTATSVTLTILGCRIRFRILISRKLDIGMPSVSLSIRIFFNATICFVLVSFTLLQKNYYTYFNINFI